jgi:hypothetical protein
MRRLVAGREEPQRSRPCGRPEEDKPLGYPGRWNVQPPSVDGVVWFHRGKISGGNWTAWKHCQFFTSPQEGQKCCRFFPGHGYPVQKRGCYSPGCPWAEAQVVIGGINQGQGPSQQHRDGQVGAKYVGAWDHSSLICRLRMEKGGGSQMERKQGLL